ncbi:MAG: 1-acyl-sn-glycerol-3-phosphate acyltransferase [Bacilli bacterium]|nr:1-acyl-sn-glycerol-3-phosphate acyltransferase [Bacilli bacterium]
MELKKYEELEQMTEVEIADYYYNLFNSIEEEVGKAKFDSMSLSELVNYYEKPMTPDEAFSKKNFFELRKMTIEQISDYYRRYRKHLFDNGVELKNIKIREKIHSFLVSIIKIDRIISGEKINVINRENTKTKRPVIFACTHIGGNDVQRVFEAIKDPAYLFLGDPKGLYRDIGGVLLSLNGVICMETNNKIDRRIGKERALELLNKNGSLLIFPEGAWNISPNQPVMDIYNGTVDLARKTNAEIIPVGIEQYDNKFFVSIGKNITPEQISDMNIDEANQLLRDALATEKWRVFESQKVVDRKSMEDITVEEFQQKIVEKCEYEFSLQDVFDTMYHDKSKVDPDEAFSFRGRLR